MKSGRVVYQNGKYVDEKDAKVSIFDSALMFGDMCFEMTRSFNKEQFFLREHLERLYRGLKILQIPIEQSIEELEANLSDLGKVRFNQLENLREFLRLLNTDKHLWARTYRTPFVEKFSILDVSLH